MPLARPRAILPVILCSMLILSACAEEASDLRQTRHDLTLGDAHVAVVVHDSDQHGITFINVHENETTSIEAAREHVRTHGGRLVHLAHTGERNITFRLEDSTFVVDPNRIFTDEGIRNTLSSLGEYSDSAHEAVATFSDSLLTILGIDTLSVVVTVHNNTDENYSILSYADGGDYQSDARFVYVDRGKDIDDFFFITEPDWFSDFRSGGFNVAVQDNEQVTDDGSLSVLCGQQGIPYVNVEAQHGHLEIQVQMLAFLDRYLDEQELR